MKRIFSLVVAVAVTLTTMAQSPEAIRELIRRNPNFAGPTVTTYDNIERGKIASAPKGYKPFYFTIASRHGSRYELKDSTFTSHTEIYNRAAELGILTPLGEEIRQILLRATAEHIGKEAELTSLGQQQLRGIGRRAYSNFKSIFDSGSVEGKSSTKMRCVFSMVAFVDGLKEGNSTLPVEIEARESYMALMRPMQYHPNTSKEVIATWSKYAKNRLDTWGSKFISQVDEKQYATMLSKVVTRPDLLIEKCGISNLFMFFRNTHHLLLFSQNFGICDAEILTRTFTLEEQYLLYLFKTTGWLHWAGGWGNKLIESYTSYMRPLIDDIFEKGQAAIEGKNPHVANLRFTHDSILVPLFTILGYNDCALIYDTDWEKACCSVPFSTIIPMAANLQIVLYRNKAGEVLVRSLLNERDVFLPIECESAPFYKWEDFRALAYKNLDKLDKTRNELFPQLKR